MATLYRIKDWDKVFEVSDSRKVDGPLKWVAVRTSTDSFGYVRMTQEKARCELLAAWYLMVAVSARQNRADRGKLAHDGIPLTPTDLELMTRFPAQVFERAIAYFSDTRVGWLIPEDNPDQSGAVRTRPEPSEPIPATIQDNTIQDNSVGRSPKPAAKAAQLTDSEWLASIKANPAYQGVDVDREIGKARAWYSTRNQQLTRRKIVAWLNRCEKPVHTNTPTAMPETEPEGWRAFWRETYPPEEYPNATRWDERDRGWLEMPAQTRKEIRDGMRKRGML